ncbi:MAG: sensor histidine kinase [Flavobacteriales bacterium]
MFKAKEFKKLIGFNHTWLVICSILITGITFPFIFLGEDGKTADENGLIHSLIGWGFSALLHLANLSIFYYFKKKDAKTNVFTGIKKFFKRNYPLHLVTTAAITVLATYGPFLWVGMDCSPLKLTKSIIGTSILMSIIVGFYETAYYMTAFGKAEKEKEKLKRENIESQLEILKSQVQPHFLFNSLNTLASIIPEEPETAVKYVQNLSKVYRYILEIKDKKLIPVYEEMKCVQAYLFMLETRFGGNLRCNVVMENIQENHHIVPLSVQMLVENAVKHNVISTKKPLTISITREGAELKVWNNLQLKQEDEVASTGTGLKNIANRYQITAGKKVQVLEDIHSFTVHIPLIDVELN